MARNDLTNIARVKTWLSIPDNNQDAWLTMAVTTVSAQVLAYLERDTFVSGQNIDRFDGQGTTRQFLERYPVTSVSEVIVGSQTIPLLDEVPHSNGIGYKFEDWDLEIPGDPSQVELIGYCFPRGSLNCKVTYIAGYLQEAEPHTIAAAAAVTSQPLGVWIADNGVTSADGLTTYTKVASSPAAGQYSLSPTVTGGYVFNAADNSNAILISYSFCPYAVEQVVIELINEVRSRRGRPGAISRNLAGQEAGTYDIRAGLPGWATNDLQPFKSVIPL